MGKSVKFNLGKASGLTERRFTVTAQGIDPPVTIASQVLQGGTEITTVVIDAEYVTVQASLVDVRGTRTADPVVLQFNSGDAMPDKTVPLAGGLCIISWEDTSSSSSTNSSSSSSSSTSSQSSSSSSNSSSSSVNSSSSSTSSVNSSSSSTSSVNSSSSSSSTSSNSSSSSSSSSSASSNSSSSSQSSFSSASSQSP